MWLRRVKAGEVGGGEEAAVVAAGSQERRMAERQANGRPGTDKGRGADTLEAWVRGPGRGQCGVPHLVGCFSLSPHLQEYRGFSPSSPLSFFAAPPNPTTTNF